MYVFEKKSGLFVKEVPFQNDSFARKRMGGELSNFYNPPVTKVTLNTVNNLLVEYEDGSYLLLDQEGK